MPSFNRNEKTTCTNCGLVVKTIILSRYKKSCSKWTKSSLKRPNIFCKGQSQMNHLLTTKLAVSVLEAKSKCLTCEKNFLSFYSVQKHKESEHGNPSRIQDITVNLEPMMCDYRYQELAKSSQLVNTFWLTLISSEVHSKYSVLYQLTLLPVS